MGFFALVFPRPPQTGLLKKMHHDDHVFHPTPRSRGLLRLGIWHFLELYFCRGGLERISPRCNRAPGWHPHVPGDVGRAKPRRYHHDGCFGGKKRFSIDIRRTAAILYAVLSAGVVAFQIALAAGAPWGAYAMGGAVPGQLPPALRIGRLSRLH